MSNTFNAQRASIKTFASIVLLILLPILAPRAFDSLLLNMPAASMQNFVKLMMKRIEKRDEIKSFLKSILVSTVYLSVSLPDGSFNLSQRFCLIRVKAQIGVLNT